MPIASHPKFVIHDHRQTLLHSSTPYNHSSLFFDGMLFQSHLTRVRLGLKTIIIIIIIIVFLLKLIISICKIQILVIFLPKKKVALH
jgi:hypothetical protein